jgi:hypothetical protein
MIPTATRLVDRWLKHPEYGVAAMLQTVPRLTPEGDLDEMPKVPDIYNDMETDELAKNLEPPTSPALVVYSDADPTVDVKGDYRQITDALIVSVAYITRDMPPARASLDGGYVLRAVRKSLTRFNDQRIAMPFRELNDFKVAAVREVRTVRVAGAVGRSQLWGFVLASLTVIDSAP